MHAKSVQQHAHGILRALALGVPSAADAFLLQRTDHLAVDGETDCAVVTAGDIGAADETEDDHPHLQEDRA
ncbi:hypothetical protein ABZ752_03495 [Streptomyces roseifaciens]